MDFEKQRISLQEVKEMDMVDYLSGLGHEPSKIRSYDYWYLSPLREEKTPSFKINRKLNRWYDHALGQGGNLVDFAILYHSCTVGELLQSLSGNFTLHKPAVIRLPDTNEKDNKLEILGQTVLSSFQLLRYLEQRRISLEIADRFCREVRYQINQKVYYGIGFRNDSGGFEIRNPYIKLSSSPKDITTLKNGSDKVLAFEGFTDFLSFLTVYKNLVETKYDFVVLNSVSFFERARPFMESHQSVHLYFGRDSTGLKCTRRALSLSDKYKDESSLYQNHKDFNDWVINFGKS